MPETMSADLIKPVLRFAPSPNGFLHLGHAYSALLNFNQAQLIGGQFLLRIEDIDTQRCTLALEAAIYEDLTWLGISWPQPVRRQSEHFDDYHNALEILIDAGLVYPSFLTRGAVRQIIEESYQRGETWPCDPDGAPLHPTFERDFPDQEKRQRIASGEAFAWRLHMEKAVKYYGHNLHWIESGAGPQGESGSIKANPLDWGDVVIARKEVPTSYHLSVVIDDALQAVTHVIRGRDLFHATAVHRLLQEILGLPVPHYHHHDLILGDDGLKLSKSRHDTAIRNLRDTGLTPYDIQKMIALPKE